MKIEEKIVSDLAYNIKKDIVINTIATLKVDLTNQLIDEDREHLLSTWEEYCVNLQYEDSNIDLIEDFRNLVLNELENSFNILKLYEKAALWLKSKEGIDYLYEHKLSKIALDEIPISFVNLQDELYEMVYKIAIDYKNENIQNYLDAKSHKVYEDYTEDYSGRVYE